MRRWRSPLGPPTAICPTSTECPIFPRRVPPATAAPNRTWWPPVNGFCPAELVAPPRTPNPARPGAERRGQRDEHGRPACLGLYRQLLVHSPRVHRPT